MSHSNPELSLVRYRELWAVEDPVLDCAIFICDMHDMKLEIEFFERKVEDDGIPF